MGLTMKEKQAVTCQMAAEYKRATKKQKGQILDTLTKLTGYNRSYAVRVLRQRARPVVLSRGIVDGVKVTLVEDERTKRKKRRKRQRIHGKDVLAPLQRVWVICDGICGKRLAPYLGERYQLRARSQTKPGTLLKHQIPIRTFSDWDEQRPGFIEIDLVSHEGGNASGDYAYTLDATDVCTAWTETEAVRNRSERFVFAGLEKALFRFPFAIQGIDSDNDSAFINNHLVRYCTQEKITFTRSRPYRKNDNCSVEQKNYSVVRRAVGYRRYDTPEELQALNDLYALLRLYTNYFQPVMKLVEKTRTGSKVRKRYDRAKTPYRRVLQSRAVPKEAKQELERIYATLNPVRLGREISRLQDRLDPLAQSKIDVQQEANLEYIST